MRAPLRGDARLAALVRLRRPGGRRRRRLGPPHADAGPGAAAVLVGARVHEARGRLPRRQGRRRRGRAAVEGPVLRRLGRLLPHHRGREVHRRARAARLLPGAPVRDAAPALRVLGVPPLVVEAPGRGGLRGVPRRVRGGGRPARRRRVQGLRAGRGRRARPGGVPAQCRVGRRALRRRPARRGVLRARGRQVRCQGAPRGGVLLPEEGGGPGRGGRRARRPQPAAAPAALVVRF
mmetsp:Transcript_29606/g.83469  ORF Transcript_29606/g.83469 Transcript_29606/m.83469 type:complete len:235 (+) Transcript_29606:622-1326(+)